MYLDIMIYKSIRASLQRNLPRVFMNKINTIIHPVLTASQPYSSLVRYLTGRLGVNECVIHVRDSSAGSSQVACVASSVISFTEESISC